MISTNILISNYETNFEITKQNTNIDILSKPEIEKCTENIAPLHKIVEKMENQCDRDVLLKFHRVFIKCREDYLGSNLVNFEILNDILLNNNGKIEYFHINKSYGDDVSNAYGTPYTKQREIVSIKYRDDGNYKINIRRTPLYYDREK